MGKFHTFRNDDVGFTSDWRLLDQAHLMIRNAGKRHVIAVLMERLWDNKEIWFWLMDHADEIEIGLHGWQHHDYSTRAIDDIHDDIRRSLELWNNHRKAYPAAKPLTVFYPPWNRVGQPLIDACAANGMTVDAAWKKDTGVYGFHSWELMNEVRLNDLRRALK